MPDQSGRVASCDRCRDEAAAVAWERRIKDPDEKAAIYRMILAQRHP